MKRRTLLKSAGGASALGSSGPFALWVSLKGAIPARSCSKYRPMEAGTSPVTVIQKPINPAHQ